MMKILVTGANGYLGQGIVKRLLDDEIDVIATDIHISNLVDERAVKKEGNLFEIDDVYSFFGKPDCLLHLAWRNGFVHNDPSHIEDLPKHYVFLKKMLESGIDKISVMGSMHEIGFFEGSIDENTPARPQSLYGISKNALREIVQVICSSSNVPWQWIRGYYIVGNTRSGSSIFSKITEAENAGQKYFPFTSGLNQWDFIDYDDFCRMAATVVEQDEINGIINVCHGRPEKLADRVERFISENGYKIKLDYGKFPDRPYDSKAVWGNDTKIKQVMREYEKKKDLFKE